MKNLKMLSDYFTWEFGENDDEVIVDGKIYPYEMTLSSAYSDAECMRVLIDGQYYHFG